MNTFFDVKGNVINKEEFICLYSNIYYYLNDVQLEKEIDDIFQKGKAASVEDYVSYIRWKVGDKGNDGEIATNYGAKINKCDFEQLAYELKNTPSDFNLNDYYSFILNQGVKNIGGVYTLALISLISKGKYPIYDKFADIAINVIKNREHGFKEKYDYTELPDKTCEEEVLKRYDEYIKNLNEVFGEEWSFNRNIDRALWTYGHLFR